MRYTLGYDKELAAGYVFTAEYMYSRGLNQLFYQNIALGGVQGVDRYGRVMYGPAPLQPVKVGGTYVPATAVSSGGYSKTQVFEISNSSKDWSQQFTIGLTRRYMNNFEASLFYTHTEAQDVQSLTSSTTSSQYTFGKSYGAVAQNVQDLGHSVFETSLRRSRCPRHCLRRLRRPRLPSRHSPRPRRAGIQQDQTARRARG